MSLSDMQVVAGIALVFLICLIVVADWFERAIQDDVNEHDGFDQARKRREGAADE